MRVVQETENLFRLTRLGMINCFLVREADGFTLVDAGLRGSAGDILKAASQLGAPIRRIVLTHAHIDHIGSLDSLMATLPSSELSVGQREARLLAKDLSLDAGEHGKSLQGFTGAKSQPTHLLIESDRIGSLQAVSSPGHTPGHMAFLDVRDNALIAGDAVMTQTGVMAAGVFKLLFPFTCSFFMERSALRKERRKIARVKSEPSCGRPWPVDSISGPPTGCSRGRGFSPAP